jgi:hypothetical protein
MSDYEAKSDFHQRTQAGEILTVALSTEKIGIVGEDTCFRWEKVRTTASRFEPSTVVVLKAVMC